MNRICGLMAALALCWGAASQASAQTPGDEADPALVEQQLRDEPPPPTSPRRPVTLPPTGEASSALMRTVLAGAIRVDGAVVAEQSDFAAVVERYVGRTLGPADLRQLASDVAAVAHDLGYPLASARIPEQRVANGVLRVELDEGRIDSVEISGGGRRAVEPILAALADGKPVRGAILERQLLLAEDVAGVRLGKARLKRQGGRNILAVSTARDRVVGRLSLDNWGTSTSGPFRARAGLQVNDLGTRGGRLALDGVMTPFDLSEFALLRATYRAPFGRSGSEAGVGGYVARSETDGEAAPRNIDGRSSQIEADLQHPLVRSRAFSLWVGLGGRFRESRLTRDEILIRDDRLAILSADLVLTSSHPKGRLRGGASVVRGFDLFGATERGDPLASRSDAGGVFVKVQVWGDYERRLGRKFSLMVLAEAQTADRPLLSSEEMGLGGRYFGRAWDYREFAGERGLAAAVELRFDLERPAPKVTGVQIYSYVDAGTVESFGRGSRSLASAGGGLRLHLPKDIQASFELGVPLTDGAEPARRDRPRFSLRLDKRF